MARISAPWQHEIARIYHPRRGADYVWGYDLLRQGDKGGTLSRLLGALGQGSNEIVCHPGYRDPGLNPYDRYRGEREAELMVLCQYPWELLGVCRLSFAQLESI